MSEVFGQSEAPATITLKAPWDYQDVAGNIIESRLASVGRPGIFNEVAILDEEGREVPRGTAGEICVRGDLVTPGYYKNAEATEAVRTFGWHHTGDIGVMDTEGYVQIVDRKKDMVITGGFNVYPNQIEQILSQHSAVHESAVIGVPDDKWGEAVTGYVVLKTGASVEEADLIRMVKEKLGSVHAPKRVWFVDDLPKSPNGKVLKTELRKLHIGGSSKR